MNPGRNSKKAGPFLLNRPCFFLGFTQYLLFPVNHTGNLFVHQAVNHRDQQQGDKG